MDSRLINGVYVWRWHPWFQHYLTALTIGIFGYSVASARLAFAFTGIMTIVLLYFMSKDIFKSKWIAFLLSVHLLLLPSFFLYARQVRYYAPAAFFSAGIFWLLLRVFRKDSVRHEGKLLFASGMLLFLTNYLMWASTIPLMAGMSAYRKKKSLIIPIAAQVSIAFLWYLFLKPYNGNVAVFGQLAPKTVLGNLAKYASYTNLYIFPLVCIPVALWLPSRLKAYLPFALAWIGVKFLFNSVFLIPHGRYLIDLIPIFILLFGPIYQFAFEKQRLIVPFIFAFGVLTNTLNVAPICPIAPKKCMLYLTPRLLYEELRQDYPSAIVKVADYLNAQYKKGDLYWTNAYSSNIQVHTKVPMVSPVCDARSGRYVGPAPVTDPDRIRWFIFFTDHHHLDFQWEDLQHDACLKGRYQAFASRYEKMVFPISDSFYMPNDPDMVNRAFPPRQAVPGHILIYQKKE